MTSKGGQKAVVILIVLFLCIWVAVWCVLLAFVGAGPVVVTVIAILNVITLIWLGIHAKERLEEIDEGLEDAVNDY